MSAFTVSAAAPTVQVRASVGPARRGASVRVSQPAPKGLGSVSLPTARRGESIIARNSAAAGAGGMDDPYKVLGVPEGTAGDDLSKAINRKKLLYKTEPEKLKQMEDAYERIVQASLAARLRGDSSGVTESARKGDLTPSLFGPWAPIPSEAPLKDKKVNIAISVAALVIVWLTPGTIRTIQPIIYATIFQIFRMFMKLVDVDPGPSANIDRDAATKHNNKRLDRKSVV